MEKSQYFHQVYSRSEKSNAARNPAESSLCMCNFLTGGDRGGHMDYYAVSDRLFDDCTKWSAFK